MNLLSRLSGALDRLAPERLFILIAPLLYVAYALLTPPFQTPDEHQHLFRAWQIASFDIVGEKRGDEAGGMLAPSLGRAAAPEIGSIYPHAARDIRMKPISEMFARQTPLGLDEPRRFTNFFGSVIYPPTSYGPQVAAIWIGRGLDFSVESILRLARLLNAALAILLLWAAIRLVPVGKRVLLIIGLSPPVAAFTASMGQDGLVIGLSALLVAASVRAVAAGRWDRRGAAILGAAATLVTLAKIVYLPLAAIALVPLRRGARGRAWFLPPLLSIAVALLFMAAWQAVTAGAVVKFGPQFAASSDQINLVLTGPIEHFLRVARTYWQASAPLLWSTFLFGWLTVGPAYAAGLLSLLALALVVLAGDERSCDLPLATRLWTMVLVSSSLFLLATVLFIYFNPPNTHYVSGMQGRYLLPLLMALAVPLLRMRPPGGNNLLLALLLSLGANIAALWVIMEAFYSF
jgi:hypothetical protein